VTVVRVATPLAATVASRFQGRLFMKKKLTLSTETLRTLDEKELSQIVGGDQSGANVPPKGGPGCPNTKAPGCQQNNA
jgi:bacteriocin-like protein